MTFLRYLLTALMLTLVIPAVGQEIPMYSDTLWHFDGNRNLYPFNGKSNGCVFAPGNNTLYSGTEAGLIALYDPETGSLKDTILLEQKIIYGLDVNADGSRILVYVKDTAAGRYLYQYYSLVIEYPSKQIIADSIPWAGHTSKISPDGRFIGVTSNWVFDLETRLVLEVPATTSGRPVFALGGSRVVSSCKSSPYSPDSRYSLRVFDYLNNKIEIDTVLGNANYYPVLTAHGDLVAVLGDLYERTVNVYRLPSMENVWTKSFPHGTTFDCFDFLDAEHLIIRIQDSVMGLGTWIYKIGTTKPVSKTIELTTEAPNKYSATSGDGRFLFVGVGATLTAIDLRGFSTTSVESDSKHNGNSVIYPNPVQGTFTLLIPACASCDVTWEVISLTGERSKPGMSRTNETGSMTAQLPSTISGAQLSQGRYTLFATSGSRSWSFALVVQ